MWTKVKGELKASFTLGRLPLHINGVLVWCPHEVEGIMSQKSKRLCEAHKGLKSRDRDGLALPFLRQWKEKPLGVSKKGGKKEKKVNPSLKGYSHGFVFQFTSDWAVQEISSLGFIKEVPLSALVALNRS